MKVLLSWMREFAPDIDGDPATISETLSGLGLAVEDMTVIGGGLEGVVVAEVSGLRPHPEADRIQLVYVDAGEGPVQVCCGAFNMAVGDRIAFATIGTVMPDGMEIAQRTMRGEISNGMCCSGEEIGLGGDHEGIMILGAAAADVALGTPITKALGVEPDVCWDLEINANRPDAMSVAGVARDLAAAQGVGFAYPEYDITEVGTAIDAVASVEIVDDALCGRFVARVLRNVSVGESPAWMQARLLALGMRPINSVVDVSNYVMLELGQPNHTYDLATVPGGALRVRRALAGETLVTLDGVERTLAVGDGVIADSNDRAIGLAGVMGGEATEISPSTTEVLLEMAWWDPPSVSRTVKRLGLPSEASTRYRRGADWGDNLERASRRFVQLLAEFGATTDVGFLDERGNLPSTDPVRVRCAKVNGLLGTDLGVQEISELLAPIGFVAEPGDEASDGELALRVPSWRWDTATETDIIEEIARMYGYERIVRTVPTGSTAGGLSDMQRDRRLVRDVLVGAGCDETQPLPFLAPGDLAAAGLSEDAVTLANPLVADESVLRTSLLPGQLKAIAYNQSHRNPRVRFFEIGHVYLPDSRPDALLPDEFEALGVALEGAEGPDAVAVLDLIAAALALPNLVLRAAEPPGMHPTRSAEVLIAGKVRGHVGEVDPGVLDAYGVSGRVGWLALDLERVLAGPHGRRRYRRVSKFPSSDIDLAFEVSDDIDAARIEGSLRKAAADMLVGLELFDVYRGEGVGAHSRSLAYRLRFQAADRTLTDSEVAELRQECIATVQRQHGATLRS